MANSMKHEPFTSMLLAASVAGALATAATALGNPTGNISPETIPGPYAKRTTLQETMLATRASFAETTAAQAAARAAVKLGPWHLSAAPLSDGHAGRATIDLAAKMPDGKPAWIAKPEWPLAKPFDWPGQSAVLCRTITAEKPVSLLIGAGGGDRLELYLSGRPVLSSDTSIPYGRYGTSFNLDGSRVDQVVCTLSLAAGENQLVMKLDQTSAGPRQAFFSIDPNPVPFFWRRIEKDFPRRTHRLLEVVRFDWFRSDAWFARSDLGFERQLLGRVLKEQAGRASGLSDRIKALEEQDVPAGDRRWLDLCVSAAEFHAAMRDIERLRASVASLSDTYGGTYPGKEFQSRIDDLQRRLCEKVSSGLDPSDAATVEMTAELRAYRREMLVAANPLLKGREVLFIRRYTYDSQHFYDDYYHGVRKYGGGICRLSINDGKTSEVLPELSGGVFDRFDLSFDGRRIVFGYRPPRPEGFRIWESNVDGSGLKQITLAPDNEADLIARYSLYSTGDVQANPILHGHWTDDMHPCYLPDGQIVFASSRCQRTAVCGGHTLPCTVLYKINPDGSGMQRLSQGMLSEFTPTVLSDGRILYNRWEYVFKGIAAVQPLWAMRPDGTGSEEVYGDNIRDPGVFYQARQVPGRPDLIVCNGCGHEPLSVGAVLLVDLHKDKRSKAAMTSLTPDTESRDLRGLFQRRNGQWRANDLYGPFYCDPYPLSDKYFLVSCNPDRRHNDESAYGIYLLDIFGNCVPVHDDAEMSCFVPTLLAAREKPPVLPPQSKPAAVAESPKESPSNRSSEGLATVLMTDVYRGLPGVRRGEVKHLRVLRQIPRPWSVWPSADDDAAPGQMVAVSWHSHIWIAVLEGIVPVHPDGSAHFTVPADANIFFEALDENYMEIQRMRTSVNFRPGEKRSCIGCHEHRNQSPAEQLDDVPAALALEPVPPGPQPGDAGPRPLHYETDVQPIFDKHCVSCHGNREPEGGLVLSGDLTTHFNRSYEQIMSKELIKVVVEWSSPPGKGSSWYWSMEHAPAVAPHTYGSHASPLVKTLLAGHYDVELSLAEFVKLTTWVDTNGQYYGSYFGFRNVRYKDHKDFRPYPTLESANGTRPGFDSQEALDPVPAELAARWTFDEGQGETAHDVSGGEHHGTIVGAGWSEGRLGGGLSFSGNADFVRVGDVGETFETLSIAHWLKVESHKNRWNALLFCDDWSEHDLHLSVLDSGNPNVAINGGSPSGHHRAADGTVGGGRWHHLAVVCDQRTGGAVQFYLDGKPDRRHPLFGLEMPVKLTGVRLGGYNVWEQTPGANFHGLLDEFQIYRGMLTAEQVARLAGGAESCIDERPGRP
jgi:hypothetical protein